MLSIPIWNVSSIGWALVYTSIGILAWLILGIVYNLLFHPLARKYQGPLLAQASILYQVYFELTGRMPHKLEELHRKYGRIVRIAPNELSFDDPTAWQDIYGRGKNTTYNSMSKDPSFYGPGANGVPSILVCNDEEHQRFRKLLNHAFTSRAVMSQQEILHHHASKLINGLREKSQQKDAKINMCLWFDSFGLDVISDLIYGQSFNCLHSKGSPTRETDMIASSFKASTWYRAIRRMPGLVQVIIKAMLPKEVVRKRQIRMQYSIQKIRERMQRPSERPDVYHFISGSGDSSKMSADEMASSISVLLGAGSETTATTLCGCIYFLLQSPGVFQQLQSEIVQQFQTEEEITWNKLNSIRFLTAVIDETMRLYPPTPSTLQRRVPAVGATIAGKSIPPGTIVGVNHYVAHRSPRHFVNATEWTPKRWLGDEAFEADDKSAFRPFLLGPRNCVGQNLADAELRIILARLVWNFDLKLEDKSEDWLTQKVLTFWCRPELKVKITPRQNA